MQFLFSPFSSHCYVKNKHQNEDWMWGPEYSSSNEWNLFRAPWSGQEGALRSPSYKWLLHLSWGFINMHWCVCWGWGGSAFGHELCRPLESQLGRSLLTNRFWPWLPAEGLGRGLLSIPVHAHEGLWGYSGHWLQEWGTLALRSQWEGLPMLFAVLAAVQGTGFGPHLWKKSACTEKACVGPRMCIWCILFLTLYYEKSCKTEKLNEECNEYPYRFA